MFKKRNIKGTVRNKLLISYDSASESSDEDLALNQKKRKGNKVEINEPKLKKQEISKEQESLTKNDLSVKVDSLNQELIDEDLQRKKEQSDSSIKDFSEQYIVHLKPKPSTDMNKIGPKKAASNIRSTTVFDYQRDICKDYRLTGFCGYGDSCKFLHARDDFKAGWKLNNDWDLETKIKIEKDLKDIPFKCLICQKDYNNPIRTSCNHYFCEACFLTRSKKTSSCAVCGGETNGAALPAKTLKELLQKQTKQNTVIH